MLQDAISQEKRSKFQQMIQGQMDAKEALTVLFKMELASIHFTMNPDDLPASDEELSSVYEFKLQTSHRDC